MKESILSILFILFAVNINGQRINTDIPDIPFGLDPVKMDRSIYWEGWKKVDFPFSYVNDLIIVEVVLNETLPLKFIFDTGAEHTILTKIEIAELLGMRYDRKFTIMGADMKTELYAYLISDVNLKLGKLFSPRENILVLEEDYFRFEEVAGMEIHGILGASFFRQFVVEIDYQSKLITFIRPKHFNVKKRKFQNIDIEVFRNKPYLYADMNIVGDSSRQVKLLVDTGASLPLLIYTNTDSSLQVPPNSIPGNVGRGLGGYLSGYQGRVHSLEFSDFQFGDIVTSFQESDSINQIVVLNDRNGIVGNKILKRFEVIIDYWGETIYLRPNRNYKTKFKYDRSGLVVLAAGTQLNKFFVQQVIKASPADRAGLQKGDEIISINRIPAKAIGMGGIVNILQKREGKKIKLVVKREKEKQKFTFLLENLI